MASFLLPLYGRGQQSKQSSNKARRQRQKAALRAKLASSVPSDDRSTHIPQQQPPFDPAHALPPWTVLKPDTGKGVEGMVPTAALAPRAPNSISEEALTLDEEATYGAQLETLQHKCE